MLDAANRSERAALLDRARDALEDLAARRQRALVGVVDVKRLLEAITTVRDRALILILLRHS